MERGLFAIVYFQRQLIGGIRLNSSSPFLRLEDLLAFVQHVAGCFMKSSMIIVVVICLTGTLCAEQPHVKNSHLVVTAKGVFAESNEAASLLCLRTTGCFLTMTDKSHPEVLDTMPLQVTRWDDVNLEAEYKKDDSDKSSVKLVVNSHDQTVLLYVTGYGKQRILHMRAPKS